MERQIITRVMGTFCQLLLAEVCGLSTHCEEQSAPGDVAYPSDLPLSVTPVEPAHALRNRSKILTVKHEDKLSENHGNTRLFRGQRPISCLASYRNIGTADAQRRYTTFFLHWPMNMDPVV